MGPALGPYQHATGRLCPYVELEPANVLLVDVAILTLSEQMRGHAVEQFREATSGLDDDARGALRMRLARAVGSARLQEAIEESARRAARGRREKGR